MGFNYIKIFIRAFIVHTIFSIIAFLIFKYFLLSEIFITLCELALILIGTIFSSYYYTLLTIANEKNISCHFQMLLYEKAFIETMKKLNLQEIEKIVCTINARINIFI